MRFLLVLFFLVTAHTAFGQWHLAASPGMGQYSYLKVIDGKLFLTAEYGIAASTDEGYSWTRSDTGLTDFNVFYLYPFGGKLFAGNRAGVNVSTDNGSRWMQASGPSTSVFCYTSLGTTIFAGTVNQGIFHSTDSGATWQTETSDIGIAAVYEMAVTDSLLFAAVPGRGVYLSADTGKSWKLAEKIRIAETILVTGKYIFVGADSAIFRSTNNGQSWTELNTDPAMPIVVRLAAVGENIFAGTAGRGMYLSTNHGNSWRSINDGLTDIYFDAIAAQGQYLFAGSYDHSAGQLWRRPLAQLQLSAVGKTGHPSFELAQSIPNPTHGLTTISFSLAEPSFVTITLFDALGKECSTLVSEFLSEGTYDRQFNTGSFIPGLYFYRLEAGKYSRTKTLIVN